MATFNSFSNILPDPVRKITDQGDIDSSGVPGPGFSALHFVSNEEVQVSRTNSGRGVSRDQEVQYWSFTIRYNPLTREQFDPVDAFLASRNARKNPFFVVLPQYSRPKDATFAGYAALNTISAPATPSGKNKMLVTGSSTISGTLKPGDMFTITDPANVNHLKVYKVTRVETNARYQNGTTQPSTSQMRIHFAPPLQRSISSSSILKFIDPMFRVVTKSDLREYDLDIDGLYSFSLDCEEIQP